MNAEESIRNGDLAGALAALQAAARDDPAKPELRTFLFQLYAVMGDWNRALTQLNVVADMDASTLLMAQTYRELLQCEAFRAEVFTGQRAPLLFGEPRAWLASLVQASGEAHSGQVELAARIALGSMEQAVARRGRIDGQPFDWLADADMRLGPVFELVIDGRYYWVPMEHVAEIRLAEPEDLRDLVWLPVQIRWTHQGRSVGFMPTRYPGEATLAEPARALARQTDWLDLGADFHIGAGQRMFSTAEADHSLLQTRLIEFDDEGARSDQGKVPVGDTPD